MAAPESTRDADRTRVGTVLHDKWTLERLLGVGGMGAVYAARHRNGARAAVKIFSPQNANQSLRDRFLREGYAANKVEHPGAVKVLDDDVIDKGPDEGLAYLVMELLEGESLFERSNREPRLTERDLLAIADAILAVLESAHANGVVHRDLKPENLFLAKNAERPGRDEIKVLDFGLARLLETQEQSWNGMAFGTPMFMSPEQAAGKISDIDGRTDLYALGAILFQLSSGKPIHEAMHTLGLVVRMATTPAPKLRAIAPEVSEPFAAIVDRALAFDRADRYANATAMRADVGALLAARANEPSTLTVEAGPSFATRPTVLAADEVGPPSERVGPPSERRTVASAPRALAAAAVDERLTSAPRVRAADAEGDRVTRAEPAVARANAAEPEPPAEADAPDASTPTSPRGRALSAGVLVVAALAVAAFVAFDHRADVAGTLASKTGGPESPSAAPASAALPPDEVDDPDAGDDEDDEEDLDAGAGDAAPASSASTRALSHAPKKPGPHRPQPKKKKKRWHG